MKVLVTGDVGFIGAALVQDLLKRGYDVAGLDRNELEPNAGLRRYHHYTCDLPNAERLKQVVSEFAPDAIAHLAARTDLFEKHDLKGYDANIAGVANLVEAIRQTPSVKRCIWTSSQMVCDIGYVPRDALDYRPHTVYGQSKVETEKIVRASDGAGREWCVVRPTTVWGPGMSAHYQRLLGMIKRGLYVHVGSDPLYKSYGYVENITHQYIELLEALAESIQGRTFYLCDYEPIDLIAWCDSFQKALRAKPIRRIPRPVAQGLARVGDTVARLGFDKIPFTSFRLRNVLTQYRFDTKDTEAVCGPLPVSTEEGVKRTAMWYEDLQANKPQGA